MTKLKKETGAAIVPLQSKSMLQVVAEAAMNPACDVGKMKALLDMQRELEAEEARKAFNRDFIEMKSELPITIDKDGLIDHGTGKQKSRYATYPHLMAIIEPVLQKYGFFFTSLLEAGADGSMFVVSRLRHRDGHCDTSRRPLERDTTGSKNAAQAIGSGQQYGMRYNLIAMLNIASKVEADDNDGYPPKPKTSDFPGDRPMKDDPISSGPVRISKAQCEELVMVMEDCGVTTKAVLDKYRIKRLVDLPESLLPAAITACLNYKKAKANKG